MKNDNTSAHPAREYDAGVRGVIPFYDTLQAEVLDLVGTAQPGASLWVDTGCGTGSLAEKAIAAFPKTRFLLADPSEAMLAEARVRLAGNPRINAFLATGSAGLAGAVAAGSAQVVTAILCHHYLDKPARLAALQSCGKILEKGGLLVVVENTDCESAPGRDLMLARWRRFQLARGRTAEAVQQHLARFGTELRPIRVAEHLELFHEAGFPVAELFWRAHAQAGFFAVKR